MESDRSKLMSLWLPRQGIVGWDRPRMVKEAFLAFGGDHNGTCGIYECRSRPGRVDSGVGRNGSAGRSIGLPGGLARVGSRLCGGLFIHRERNFVQEAGRRLRVSL